MSISYPINLKSNFKIILFPFYINLSVEKGDRGVFILPWKGVVTQSGLNELDYLVII